MADPKMGEIIQLIVGPAVSQTHGKALQLFAIDTNGRVWQAVLLQNGQYQKWSLAVREE